MKKDNKGKRRRKGESKEKKKEEEEGKEEQRTLPSGCYGMVSGRQASLK